MKYTINNKPYQKTIKRLPLKHAKHHQKFTKAKHFLIYTTWPWRNHSRFSLWSKWWWCTACCHRRSCSYRFLIRNRFLATAISTIISANQNKILSGHQLIALTSEIWNITTIYKIKIIHLINDTNRSSGMNYIQKMAYSAYLTYAKYKVWVLVNC